MKINILLTNCLEMSTSSEAAGCAVIQERPNISGDPKIHYPVQKSQINSIHTPRKHPVVYALPWKRVTILWE
jgi:hypothetical protein